jgi:putative transposase
MTMLTTRKSYPPSLKAKISAEAIKAQKTITELAQMYHVNPNLIAKWKKQALEGLPEIFRQPHHGNSSATEAEKDELFKQIGQLEVELEWPQKSLGLSIEEKRRCMAPHPHLTLARQCELLGLPRSTFYYQPAGETTENLCLMWRLDELYLELPYFGSRKFAVVLGQEWRRPISRKRVQRLMRLMGIEALYPNPNLSRPAPGHEIYPYLLRDVVVSRPNQVWSTDITYIPMRSGFLYLVAIQDWFSRFVLSWDPSNTMEIDFCRSTWEAAWRAGSCEIFHSDQGSQFIIPSPRTSRGSPPT